MKAGSSSDGRTARVWGALELELPERVHERIIAELPVECLGVEVHDDSSGTGGLTAYFGSEDEARRAARRLAGLLEQSGLGARRPRVRAIADGGWVERYQASLRPFDVGVGFTIDPAGGGSAVAGRRSISLIPGRAFGTGEHPTTRLCIGAVERYAGDGERWIDLGCGSGILAVVAAKCGVAEVLALDVDPEAIGVAREVVRVNGVEPRVRVTLGGAEEATPGCWNGVVVNISVAFLEQTAGRLRGLPLPGGIVVASGFLENERDVVSRTLGVAPLVELSRETLDGWGMSVFGLPREGER